MLRFNEIIYRVSFIIWIKKKREELFFVEILNEISIKWSIIELIETSTKKQIFELNSIIILISSSQLNQSVIEWPSSWIKPELGCPILGLGRVGHILLARADRTDWGFCSSELLELGLLFDELNRTDIVVRRTLNSNFGSYKKLGLRDQF